jgi:hypothetical protein
MLKSSFWKFYMTFWSVGQGMKQTSLYLWLALFQAQWYIWTWSTIFIKASPIPASILFFMGVSMDGCVDCLCSFRSVTWVNWFLFWLRYVYFPQSCLCELDCSLSINQFRVAYRLQSVYNIFDYSPPQPLSPILMVTVNTSVHRHSHEKEDTGWNRWCLNKNGRSSSYISIIILEMIYLNSIQSICNVHVVKTYRLFGSTVYYKYIIPCFTTTLSFFSYILTN